jgi:Rrf2 family transcriptional regulator, cysteine metabolism repressor
MFSLSAKGVYGLSALMELGLHYGKGSMQIRDIAERHNIPQHYLEQILVILKKAGHVESYRGAQGGYALSRDPDSVQISEVLSQLEGRLQVVADDKRDTVLGFFWDELERGLKTALDRTLGDLLRSKADRDQQIHYVI